MIDRWLRWAAPAALLAVTLAHPILDGNAVLLSLGAVLPRWEVVHLLQLAPFPLVALSTYRLIPATAGREHVVARAGFVVFAIAISAFDWPWVFSRSRVCSP